MQAAEQKQANTPSSGFVPPCPAWLARAMTKSGRRINFCWKCLLFLQNLAMRIDFFKCRWLRALRYGWMLNHGWVRSQESSSSMPGRSLASKLDIQSQAAQSK